MDTASCAQDLNFKVLLYIQVLFQVSRQYSPNKDMKDKQGQQPFVVSLCYPHFIYLTHEFIKTGCNVIVSFRIEKNHDASSPETFDIDKYIHTIVV